LCPPKPPGFRPFRGFRSRAGRALGTRRRRTPFSPPSNGDPIFADPLSRRHPGPLNKRSGPVPPISGAPFRPRRMGTQTHHGILLGRVPKNRIPHEIYSLSYSICFWCLSPSFLWSPSHNAAKNGQSGYTGLCSPLVPSSTVSPTRSLNSRFGTPCRFPPFTGPRRQPPGTDCRSLGSS
jgi:hypothetical protein